MNKSMHSYLRARTQLGQSTVEFVVLGLVLVPLLLIVPLIGKQMDTLLFLLMNLIQYGLLYHAKSQVNYAAFEAARAGTVSNANPVAIRTAFTRAMTGYYGGGKTTADLAKSLAKAAADSAAIRIEIISPTKESFVEIKDF